MLQLWILIVAQRLVRKICPHCKWEKIKTPQEQALIESMMIDIWLSTKQQILLNYMNENDVINVIVVDTYEEYESMK